MAGKITRNLILVRQHPNPMRHAELTKWAIEWREEGYSQASSISSIACNAALISASLCFVPQDQPNLTCPHPRCTLTVQWPRSARLRARYRRPEELRSPVPVLAALKKGGRLLTASSCSAPLSLLAQAKEALANSVPETSLFHSMPSPLFLVPIVDVEDC